MTNKIARLRAQAFANQQGLCCYCYKPMCNGDPQEFALTYSITLRQARQRRCTAEHLIAQQDGGSDSAANIAAACLYCNRTRHLSKNPLRPDRYRTKVQRAMARGRWHGILKRLQRGSPSEESSRQE
ncbi:MAG: HNH endonuclease [Gammaproteobacteria bacterium]|nr:HNH endonuclease [Gammaproteobacteria bacterium]